MDEAAEPVNPEHLIPYPDKEKAKAERKFTVATAKMLARLMDEKMIPARARQYIQNLDEIERWRTDGRSNR